MYKNNLVIQNSEVSVGGKEMSCSATDNVWVCDFTEQSAKKFSEDMLKRSSNNPDEPIIVFIDSYGGSVDALATMIAVMDSIPNKIITVSAGKAMSCGAILLSHGDKRFVTDHSRIMIHEVSFGTGGHVEDVKTHTKELNRVNNYFMELLAKNCKIKGGYKSLKKMFVQNRDIYLTPKEALKFGIVDHLGVPRLNRKIQVEYSLDF